MHVHGLDGVWHPAQIYDSAMVMVGVFLLTRLEGKLAKRGSSFGWTLVIYGVSRFIDEFWRIGGSSEKFGSLPLSLAQIVAVLTVAVGAAFIFLAKPVQVAAPIVDIASPQPE